MAKSFNFTLFFKKNENLLLVVGLALIALFVFGVNGDVMGAIQIFRKDPEEVKGVDGGCQLVEGFNYEDFHCDMAFDEYIGKDYDRHDNVKDYEDYFNDPTGQPGDNRGGICGSGPDDRCGQTGGVCHRGGRHTQRFASACHRAHTQDPPGNSAAITYMLSKNIDDFTQEATVFRDELINSIPNFCAGSPLPPPAREMEYNEEDITQPVINQWDNNKVNDTWCHSGEDKIKKKAAILECLKDANCKSIYSSRCEQHPTPNYINGDGDSSQDAKWSICKCDHYGDTSCYTSKIGSCLLKKPQPPLVN